MDGEWKVALVILGGFLCVIGVLLFFSWLETEQTNSCIKSQSHRAPIEARAVCRGIK